MRVQNTVIRRINHAGTADHQFFVFSWHTFDFSKEQIVGGLFSFGPCSEINMVVAAVALIYYFIAHNICNFKGKILR